MKHRGHRKRRPSKIIALIAATSVYFMPSAAKPLRMRVAASHGISVDACSRHPDLFKTDTLSADEAMRLIRPDAGPPTIYRFESGHIVSGECARFIKTFADLMILTNGGPPPAPGTGPQPSVFKPPNNVLSIAPDTFSEGKGRDIVQNIGTIVLWSGLKGSAIGTLRCAAQESYPCRLNRLILSSPYKIRKFGFIPSPDGEVHVGSLWFWVTIRPDEQAIARYEVKW